MLKTPIVEVKWGSITYTQTQIRELSIQLGKDGKSNSCTVQLLNNVDIPPRGSPIGILIYYVGSPYEFYATFSHVGTKYAVGNEQYIEIQGGSLLWSSSNQTPQNKQYFSGNNSVTINLKDFLVKFCKEKFKKDVVWQASKSDQAFSYAAQNGETDLAFFERVLKSFQLEYKEDNNLIIILDRNTLVDRSYNLGAITGGIAGSAKQDKSTEATPTATGTKPRVIYVDVGIVRDIVREFQPDNGSSSSAGATTDAATSANSSNSPVISSDSSNASVPKPEVFNSKPSLASGCLGKTYQRSEGGTISLQEVTQLLPNIKKKSDLRSWQQRFALEPWINDPCLIYFAIHDVAKQLDTSPTDLATIGCFESEWNGSRSPNQESCVGVFQCCPSSNYCGYGSQKTVYASGTVGQIYAIGFLLADTTGYAKVQKPIPLLNLYAGVLRGNFLSTDDGGDRDSNGTYPSKIISDARAKKCFSASQAYINDPLSKPLPNSGNGTATGSSTGTTPSNTSSPNTATAPSTGTVDNLPFKCRLTVDMCPRFTGVKSGDLLVIPSDNYTGTEDFVIESVNYEKNGSSFDLQITGGRPIAPTRLAQDEIYNFVKEINSETKYLNYLWGL